jgi:hypothetical protein
VRAVNAAGSLLRLAAMARLDPESPIGKLAWLARREALLHRPWDQSWCEMESNTVNWWGQKVFKLRALTPREAGD